MILKIRNRHVDPVSCGRGSDSVGTKYPETVIQKQFTLTTLPREFIDRTAVYSIPKLINMLGKFIFNFVLVPNLNWDKNIRDNSNEGAESSFAFLMSSFY